MPLSEFEIISRYFAPAGASQSVPGVILGPGDDCAVIRPEPGQDICISTDTLVQGVHFPTECDPAIIASRSLAVNLSDLAAMGSRPFAFTLALTLSEVNEHWLEAFAASLHTMASRHGIHLIGGNLASGPLSLTIQVLGLVEKGSAITRTGARLDDDIYVSGTLGDAAMGVRLLNGDERKTANERDRQYVLDRYYYPEPRWELGRQLKGIASSAIDISDGLLGDLGHICQSSHLGAVLFVNDLPLSAALVNLAGRAAALEMALSGGDDYELCFTASADKRKELDSLGGLTRIGKMTGESGQILDQSGQKLDIHRGWDHFGGRPNG